MIIIYLFILAELRSSGLLFHATSKSMKYYNLCSKVSKFSAVDRFFLLTIFIKLIGLEIYSLKVLLRDYIL